MMSTRNTVMFHRFTVLHGDNGRMSLAINFRREQNTASVVLHFNI